MGRMRVDDDRLRMTESVLQQVFFEKGFTVELEAFRSLPSNLPSFFFSLPSF